MNTFPTFPTHVRIVSAGLLAASLLSVKLPAQAPARQLDTTPPARVEPAKIKKSDRDFFEKAAKAGMAEVAISRVAASRTSNPDVRRFAQMMIEEHESAHEQLVSLSTARGISLPAKDPVPEKWEKRDAKNFDRDYLAKMVSDHEDVVKLFEKQAKDGFDSEAVAFARQHLPAMQAHLQQAIDLKRALSEKKERR